MRDASGPCVNVSRATDIGHVEMYAFAHRFRTALEE